MTTDDTEVIKRPEVRIRGCSCGGTMVRRFDAKPNIVWSCIACGATTGNQSSPA